MTENIDLRMAEAIKLSKIAFFSYLFDGTILAIDRAAFDFFELEGIFKDPQSVIGKNIESLFVYIGPKGRIRDQIRAKGKMSKVEYGIRTLKNTEKWGIHNSYIYIDKKTGEEAIQVCFYDITDRKLHEVEIDNQYKILVENSIEVIWTMDLEGNFTYMSPSVEILRGYTVEEAMNLTLEETMTPESFALSMTELQNYLSKPVDELPYSYTIELEQYRKDGTTVWTLVTIKPIFDDDGEVFELQGGTRDISHKKKAEKDLTASEEKYRIIVDHVNDAFYAHDFKGKIIDVNPNSCKMLGYKKKELVGQHLSIFTSKEEALHIKKRMKKLIKEKMLIFEGEHITKKGKGIPVSISARVVSTEGAGLVHSFVRDISEMKEIENALIISEEKYSALVEHSRDIIVIVQDGIITYVNKAAKQITGEEPDKIIGMDFLSWIAPEYHEKVAQYYRERMAGKKVPNIYEIALIKKDGSSVSIEVNATLITYQGKPADLVIVRDISERKKVQEELNEKTEFLDAVVSNTHDGIFVVDEDFNYKYINPASGRIMGHDPEDWIGKRAGTHRHPDDEKKSTEAIFKALSGEPSTCEVRVMHSSGEYRLLEMRYSLMMIGEDAHILGVVNDITEKKKVETAMRTSEEKYRTLFEYSPESICLVDVEGRIIECNNATIKMTGYSKKELIGNSYIELGLLHKEDVEKYATLLFSALESEKVTKFEARMKHKNGETYWIEGYPSFLYENGNPNAIQIISRDITERKSTEKEMRRRFMKYELNEGNIYIVKERRHIRSADAFNELMQIGYPGLIISRKPLKHFKERIHQEYAHLWVSEREGEHNIAPKTGDIINMIDSISRGQVVFLDGINYLISKIGFKSCQSLIQALSEIAHLKDHIIIIQIDPLSLTPYQLSQFESEALEIEPQMSEGKLPEKLIDVLRFVNDSNNEGAKPSYSDLGTELELSKPTIRDRVRKLESMGYLNEMSKGRSKYLEITEKGKTYMAYK